EDAAFFPEQVERQPARNIAYRLERDLALHHLVVDLIDQAHATMPDYLEDLVATLDLGSTGRHSSHSPPLSFHINADPTSGAAERHSASSQMPANDTPLNISPEHRVWVVKAA